MQKFLFSSLFSLLFAFLNVVCKQRDLCAHYSTTCASEKFGVDNSEFLRNDKAAELQQCWVLVSDYVVRVFFIVFLLNKIFSFSKVFR